MVFFYSVNKIYFNYIVAEDAYLYIFQGLLEMIAEAAELREKVGIVQ